MPQQALEFGRKGDRSVGQPREMQRLHAQPVARQKQAAPLMIVDRKGEHAIEPRQAIRAPLPPRRQNHLGIAAGSKAVTAIFEFGAQLPEIIDFAVEADRHRFVVARHRLRAAFDVDDRQPQMPESDARRGPFARSVGTAMAHGMQHRAQPRGIDGLGRLQMINARDPTHIGSSPSAVSARGQPSPALRPTRKGNRRSHRGRPRAPPPTKSATTRADPRRAAAP